MAEKANSAALPDILVVGIAGGSGGGKTTLTSNLIRRFGDKVCIVVEQWQNTVKPMHEKYVEPSKKNADIIVPQGGKNPVALDLIVGRIQRHLDENA